MEYQPLNARRSGNSIMVFLTFETAQPANSRKYFDNDSEIDNSTIVGIETHAYVNIAGVLPYDMPQTIQIGEKQYNTMTVVELTTTTLTIVNKQRQQVLSNMPFVSLFNTPANAAFFGNQDSKKRYKKFFLDVLSGESYITFNFNSVVAPPFCVPIEFFYDDKC